MLSLRENWTIPGAGPFDIELNKVTLDIFVFAA